jgi:hypothetical protein
MHTYASDFHAAASPGVALRSMKDAARVALDASPCRCGNPMLVRSHTDKGIVSVTVFCRDRKLWGFWRHDPPRIIYQYQE